MNEFLKWIEGPVTIGLFVFVAIALYRCLVTALKIEKELKKLERQFKQWKEEDGQ